MGQLGEERFTFSPLTRTPPREIVIYLCRHGDSFVFSLFLPHLCNLLPKQFQTISVLLKASCNYSCPPPLHVQVTWRTRVWVRWIFPDSPDRPTFPQNCNPNPTPDPNPNPEWNPNRTDWLSRNGLRCTSLPQAQWGQKEQSRRSGPGTFIGPMDPVKIHLLQKLTILTSGRPLFVGQRDSLDMGKRYVCVFVDQNTHILKYCNVKLL